MKNIQVSAYVGIALDICVEIAVIILVWLFSNMKTVSNNCKDELGPFRLFTGFGKIRFVFTRIILGFGLTFADTLTG